MGGLDSRQEASQTFCHHLWSRQIHKSELINFGGKERWLWRLAVFFLSLRVINKVDDDFHTLMLSSIHVTSNIFPAEGSRDRSKPAERQAWSMGIALLVCVWVGRRW